MLGHMGGGRDADAGCSTADRGSHQSRCEAMNNAWYERFIKRIGHDSSQHRQVTPTPKHCASARSTHRHDPIDAQRERERESTPSLTLTSGVSSGVAVHHGAKDLYPELARVRRQKLDIPRVVERQNYRSEVGHVREKNQKEEPVACRFCAEDRRVFERACRVGVI